MSPRMKAALVLVWSMVAGRLAYDAVFGAGKAAVPPRRPLAEFKGELSGWQSIPLEKNIIEVAGEPSDYLNCTSPGESVQCSFYVGYYDGASAAAIHTPDVCMKGAGWSMARSESFRPASRDDLRFQLIHGKHADKVRRLSAHTLHYRGEYDPSLQRVYFGRAFGARNWAILIYTVTFGGEKDLPRAQALLEDLIVRTAPKLDAEFFPAGDPAGSGER